MSTPIVATPRLAYDTLAIVAINGWNRIHPGCNEAAEFQRG